MVSAPSRVTLVTQHSDKVRKPLLQDMAAAVGLIKQDHEYSVGRRLGSGATGAVYEGHRLEDMAPVALKIGLRGSEGLLRDEYKVYRGLEDCGSCARVLDFQSGRRSVIVMELCVSSLATLCRKRRFPVQFTPIIGKEMLRCLKGMHERGFIHRDVKPNNFLVRWAGDKYDLVIADFDMATRYRNAAGEHLNPRTTRRGTARYMSIHAQTYEPQSRRDDLESLWYSIIRFFGPLPWETCEELPTEQMNEKIKAMKLSTEVQTLCKKAPYLASGLQHIRSLGFTDEPDYALLESLLDDFSDDTRAESSFWEYLLGPQHPENSVEVPDFVPLFSTKSDSLDAVLSRLSHATRNDESGQAREDLLREAIDIDKSWTRTAIFRTTTLLAETSFYNVGALGGIDNLTSFVDQFSYKLKQLHQSSPDFIRPSNTAMLRSDPIIRFLETIRTHLARAEREVLRTGASMALLDAGESWKKTVQLMKRELDLLPSKSDKA